MSLLRHGDLIPDVVAFVGVLVFFAGMHLLWLSRRDIFGWLEEFIRLFRLSVHAVSRASSQREKRMVDPAAATGGPLELVTMKPQKKHTARIALGVLLAFFLAPMLITLGLGF